MGQKAETEIDSERKSYTHTLKEILPSETVTETCDEIHKILNHEGVQVKQNTEAAVALRRDRHRDMAD